MIEVIRPGPLATVQDLGRPGLGHLGVPRCGRRRRGQPAAGEPAGRQPAGRGRPRAHAGPGRAPLSAGRRWLAVTGAAAPVTVASRAGPGSRARGVRRARSRVPAGARAADRDARGRAAQLPGGPRRHRRAGRAGQPVGGPAVAARARAAAGGRSLPVGAAGHAGRRQPAPAARAPGTAGRAAGRAARGGPAGAGHDAAVQLRVLPGPRDDWFAAGRSASCAAPSYAVDAGQRPDRAAAGRPALPRASDGAGELPSEGMVTGALQVPPDGKPILLLADHPVTGGYPVIAVVAVRRHRAGRAAAARPAWSPSPLSARPLSALGR